MNLRSFFMQRILPAGALFAVALGATAAPAVPSAEPPVYGALVSERAQYSLGSLSRPSEMLGLSLAAGGEVSRGLGIKLGYRLSPTLSLEGLYAERPLFALLPSDARLGRAASTGLDLVGTFRVMERWSVQGRAGFRNERPHVLSMAELPPHTARGQAGLLGLGVGFDVNRSLGLRLNLERTRRFTGERGDLDSDSITFGVLWRF